MDHLPDLYRAQQEGQTEEESGNKKIIDHEIDSVTTVAHAPRRTYTDPGNHYPFTQLVTLGPTNPNLDAVSGQLLPHTKNLSLPAKE